jgi:hypothetical protein
MHANDTGGVASRWPLMSVAERDVNRLRVDLEGHFN